MDNRPLPWEGPEYGLRHMDMTSWAISDEPLTPPAVHPTPCGPLWASQRLPWVQPTPERASS